MTSRTNDKIPAGSQAPLDEYYFTDDSSSNETKSTPQDVLEMHRMGNKPVLKRNFHSASILGIVCILLSTWTSILSNATFSFINGGRAGAIWTYLATWICTFAVVASLAEMASMAPTSGGQYHWVSEFAPPRLQKSLSYLSGWLSALGWQTFIAGSAYTLALNILTMVALGQPSYVSEKWHVTVLTIFFALVALLFNVFAAKWLPAFENVLLICYVLGFFGILIPLWVLSPRVSAMTVFTEFANYGDWSSIGAATVIGQTYAATVLLGVDSAAHMAEEVKDASISVPRMMMLTVALNGALGFIMLITYAFCVQDIPTQILAVDGFPYYGVFAAATGSTGGAIAMCIPFVIYLFASTINAVMAASRQAWAFARDDGLPFPRWMLKLVKIDGVPLPLNTMFASMVILIIMALLNLGGSEIFQSLVALLSGAIGATYIISIGCVIWRRLYGAPLPSAKWSLGRMGLPINIFAFFYQTFTFVLGFFPLFSKVNAVSMNWSIAVFGGVVVLCMLYYVMYARKIYRGPVVRILKDD